MNVYGYWFPEITQGKRFRELARDLRNAAVDPIAQGRLLARFAEIHHATWIGAR